MIPGAVIGGPEESSYTCTGRECFLTVSVADELLEFHHAIESLACEMIFSSLDCQPVPTKLVPKPRYFQK